MPMKAGMTFNAGGSGKMDAAAALAWIPLALFLLAAMVAAFFTGAVTAIGNKYLLIGLVGMFGAVAVIASPATWIIWLLYLAGFLVIGPIIYFIGLSQLQWVPSVMGAVLLVQVLMHSMRGRAGHSANANLPFFLVFLIAFLVLSVFGTAVDRPSIAELINSSRWYFFYWPVMLAFMFGMVAPSGLVRLWNFLCLIVIAQLPVALYQFFFVASHSARSITPWDAVVGTFPGGEESGGQSAAMAIFILIVMLLAFALWRGRHMKGSMAMMVVASGLGFLALAEVKAAVMLLPVVLVLYYRKELLRHPVQVMALTISAVLLIVAMFAGYQKFYYDKYAADKGESRTALSSIMNALDPENISEYRPQMGRVTHFVFWWNENVKSGDIQHSLLGYGMGSVQITRVGAGQIATRYPVRMDVSSSTILLWETGLLGHVFFVLMLASAAVSSSSLSKNAAIPERHRIVLRVGAIALFLLVVTLPYKDMVLRSPGIVLLTMLLLGQVAYWKRNLADGRQKV